MTKVNPEERLSLALQHHMARRLSKARRLYEQIVVAEPENADVLHLLGAIELEAGDVREALDHLDRCLRADWDQTMTLLAATYNLKGEALRRLNRCEEALQCYRRSLEIRPDHAGVCNNMGVALRQLGRLGEAVHWLRQALRINPDLAEAHNNLGNAMSALRSGVDAVDGCEQALDVRSRRCDVRGDGVASRAAVADWERRKAAMARLAAVTNRQPCAFGHVPESAAAYSVHGDDPDRLRRLAGAEVSQALASMVPPWRPQGARGGSIRVGYLVRGGADQPARRQLGKILAGHDRTRFEPTVYSYGNHARDGSDARDGEVDLDGLSDSQAAQRIADDRLDVLVDLVGHVPGSRPGLPASRPARLAVSWSEFCTPAEPSSADVLLSDEIVLPRAEAASITERVIHLRPGHQWLMHRRGPDVGVPDRLAQKLPPDAVVLACFTRGIGIDPALLHLCLELMRDVPQSVLWLAQGHAEAAVRLLACGESAGVGRERLILAPPAASEAEHVARLACADICLGHGQVGAPTTVLDALWAGVPVLALHGALPPNRSAASVVHGAGLPDLAARDLDDYARKLVGLMRDAEARRALRTRLAAARLRTATFDPGPIVAEFEGVLGRLVKDKPPGS